MTKDQAFVRSRLVIVLVWSSEQSTQHARDSACSPAVPVALPLLWLPSHRGGANGTAGQTLAASPGGLPGLSLGVGAGFFPPYQKGGSGGRKKRKGRSMFILPSKIVFKNSACGGLFFF